ncbi:hypothetical protein E1B28_008003 [Marasmius oreades]|uniref:Uncharacterized protein n=1 Tax=Marasmius oreades TaxID=181124 RepID=A0A9P7S3B5_9AGAR|nr:uncharacterized protein E1B28_008003 [Marasmius oreades]KAG7094403.1 hypothetical protein E1B28_008003 [Marasmius oreades]
MSQTRSGMVPPPLSPGMKPDGTPNSGGAGNKDATNPEELPMGNLSLNPTQSLPPPPPPSAQSQRSQQHALNAQDVGGLGGMQEGGIGGLPEPILGTPLQNPSTDMFSVEFMNSVVRSQLEESVPGFFTPEEELNFVRDFGHWFNPEDTLDDMMGNLSLNPTTGTASSTPVLSQSVLPPPSSSLQSQGSRQNAPNVQGVGGRGMSRVPYPMTPSQQRLTDMFPAESMNSVESQLEDFDIGLFIPDDINFERDFGQWFNPDDELEW